MPKVSVIIPVYNTDKYLRKCLDSVLNQTLQDIEIIVIDDGSRDMSSAILDEYAQNNLERVKVIHKENGGQGKARNLAIGLCNGEYISFLDSDDFYDLTRLEKLYSAAIANNADYVGCGYSEVEITNNGEEFFRTSVFNKVCNDKKDMLVNRALVNPLLSFYKKDLLVENAIFFTEGFIYEDTAFWAKAVPFIQNPFYLSESLATHTIHGNSTMTIIKADRVRNIFPVIEDIIDFYKKKGQYEEYQNEVEYFCSRILLCSSIERISKVENMGDRKKLIRETFQFLNSMFPRYKSNPYFSKGKVNKYIKCANFVICMGVISFMRFRNIIRRRYISRYKLGPTTY